VGSVSFIEPLEKESIIDIVENISDEPETGDVPETGDFPEISPTLF
jgi:hypothetical protein